MVQRILIVDDDEVLVDVVQFLLRREGLEPSAAFDSATAARMFEELAPELVILDVNLGEADGRDLLRRFRQQRPATLFLMLTVLNAEEDRVLGLELGADDYLTKPFGHREFVARVRALLRRRATESHAVVLLERIELGPVVLDPATHEVTYAGKKLDISPTEFRLMQALMARPNVLVPTRTLLKEVWGHQDLTARNVLRVTASRLRAKLEKAGAGPHLLRTVPGEGLMFQAEPAVVAPPAAASTGPVALDILADLQQLGGDLGMLPLRQLHESFVKTATIHIAAMHTALAQHDSATLAQEAHRLTGTSGSLGAQRVAPICRAIERQAHAGDLALLDALLRELEQEFAAFEAAIEPMLQAAG